MLRDGREEAVVLHVKDFVLHLQLFQLLLLLLLLLLLQATLPAAATLGAPVTQPEQHAIATQTVSGAQATRSCLHIHVCPCLASRVLVALQVSTLQLPDRCCPFALSLSLVLGAGIHGKGVVTVAGGGG